MDGPNIQIFRIICRMHYRIEMDDDGIRKKNYNCDVTYGTNNEFGFDYLRDNMKYEM